MGLRRWQSGTMVGVVLVGTAAGAVAWHDAGGGPGRAAPPVAEAEPARLVSYADCGQMLDQLRAEALAAVGPYGLGGSLPDGTYHGTSTAAMPLEAAPAAGTSGTPSQASGGASPDAGSAPGFSTTNDQEQGIDEPDLAKTDGTLLVALERSTDTLQVASVTSSPSLVGSLSLGSAVQATGLFLVGADAVVVGAAVSSPDTEAVVVDLSDPAHPSVARSFHVQGSLVDARLVAGRVELVVRSSPQLPFVSPPDGSQAALSAATAENRAVVAAATPAQWLPSVTSEPSGTTTPAPCAAAMHTASSATSGLDTIGVVPIDPSSDQPGTEVTVVGDATTVYAGGSSLYVTTSEPAQPVPEPAVDVPAPGIVATTPSSGSLPPDTTAIDAFDLSDPSAPRYVGSGQVPGTLIGQYALSAYQGDLRVATTVGSATPPPGEGSAPTTVSDNRVTVLAPENGALVPIGTVSGLGAGEKIYAVRFVGPLAYVVTFRQTDPLYVVDLSDPTAPQLAGQLPLTGYSSFLEPLEHGLVLGVGQSVDENLRTDGLQVSLFDVSDPAHPALVAKDVLAGATSAAQQDPHALLYWAPTGTVVLPVVQFVSPPAGTPVDPGVAQGSTFSGAVVWRAGSSGLTEQGRVIQPTGAGVPACTFCAGAVGSGSAGVGAGGAAVMAPYEPYGGTVQRALVVGDKLYTVSDAGILESDLASLAPGTWLAFS
ncbi:MAG: beta-propeller domain-containing protein [Acidobacteriota bacterium]|nr:beta-propeller domain-containing protein [Acidobacteriota bacterium]